MDAKRNVNLWINNDEGLYNLARTCVRKTKTKKAAAVLMMAMLSDMGVKRTPDGSPYSVSSIQAAMVGM